LALAVLAGLLAFDAQAASAASATVPVTVVVKSLTALDNELESDADLYAVAHVGLPDELDKFGKFDTFGIHVDDQDHVEPNARFTVNVPRDTAFVRVVLEGWDHDNCSSAGPCNDLIDPDDRGDVAPEPEFNAATVRFDIFNGSVEGCTEGDQAGKIRLCYAVQSFEPGSDTDRDGLLDRWETDGLDTDGDGAPDVDLFAMGARWDHADLFLELDYESGQAPSRDSIQAMKAAFAAAPIFNPDGRTGIRLWVDTGTLADPNATEGQPPGSCLDGRDNGGDGVRDADDSDCNAVAPRRYLETSTEDAPATCKDGKDNDLNGRTDGEDSTCLVGDNLPGPGGGALLTTPVGACKLDDAFYAAKKDNFDLDRRWVFRYAISAAQPASCDPQTGGQGELGGNDFIEFNHDGGTVMHELGHTLNLDHGGDTGANCKPNYVSVMNYDNQFGVRRNGGGVILDYALPRRSLTGFDIPGGSLPPGIISRGPVPDPLFENDLDDDRVIDAGDHSNRFVFVNGKGKKDNGRLDERIDWADDDAGTPDDSNQQLNVDTGAPDPVDCKNDTISSTAMTGFNDWLRVSLSMNLRQFGDSKDGARNPSPDISPTLAQLRELEQRILRADIATTITGAPNPVAAGTDATYTVKVRNNGPDPSETVALEVKLAADLQFQSASAGCAHAGGVVSCAAGPLGVGQEKTFTVVARVPANLVYLNGSPKLLTTAAGADGALEDPVPANNASSSVVKAIAVADLSASEPAAPGAPAELLIGVPAPVEVRFAVANGGPSSPMDAALAVTASASAGGVASPASQTLAIDALATGAGRQAAAAVTLRCLEPGVQTFTVGATIAPTRPDDTDPNSANNAAAIRITVECVVPIAINIRPGNRDNVYNLTLNADAIPVALLTTRAGEYGLPLAFDATRVQAASLRFGQRDLVFRNEGGSLEHQQKIQRVDSFELDERTKDGDLDVRAQFARENTGLTGADSEACVKGTYVAPDGARFRFFGCDAVRVVP